MAAKRMETPKLTIAQVGALRHESEPWEMLFPDASVMSSEGSQTSVVDLSRCSYGSHSQAMPRIATTDVI